MGPFTRLLLIAGLSGCAAFGADLTGIWMGQTTGRNGEKQDIAFQFKTRNGKSASVAFGDEADLPVEDLKVDGDKISFSVTSVNYYSGSRLKLVYSGTLNGGEMRLTRERKGGPPPDPPAAGDRPAPNPEIILKRITP